MSVTLKQKRLIDMGISTNNKTRLFVIDGSPHYMRGVAIDKIIKLNYANHYKVLLHGKMPCDFMVWEFDKKPHDLAVTYEEQGGIPSEYKKENEVVRILNPVVIKKWINNLVVDNSNDVGVIYFNVLLKCDVWIKEEWN